MNIIILILRIILIIVGGLSSVDSVLKVSKESNVDFSELWEQLPDKWK